MQNQTNNTLKVRDLQFIAQLPRDFDICYRKKSWARQTRFAIDTVLNKSSIIVDYEKNRVIIDIGDA